MSMQLLSGFTRRPLRSSLGRLRSKNMIVCASLAPLMIPSNNPQQQQGQQRCFARQTTPISGQNGGKDATTTKTTSDKQQHQDELLNNDTPQSNSNSTDWIPPNRPLSGDQGHSQMYKQSEKIVETEQALEEALFVIDEENDTQEDILRKLEEALALEEQLEDQQRKQQEQSAAAKASDSPPGATDWLETRRKALGQDPHGNDQLDETVAVIPHTLLSESELVLLLENYGGTNLTVVLDDTDFPRMGGAAGMVFCTASNEFHVSSLTKALVDHLKDRQLEDLGVLGAQMGLKSSLLAANTWNVVDCTNYIVHIMDDPTRKVLKLEDLWSGKDPLWKLNPQDEEALEDYVAEHPVPPDYGPNPQQLWDMGKKLERTHYLFPHRPIVSGATKSEDRRLGRQRRRQQRQQQRREQSEQMVNIFQRR